MRNLIKTIVRKFEELPFGLFMVLLASLCALILGIGLTVFINHQAKTKTSQVTVTSASKAKAYESSKSSTSTTTSKMSEKEILAAAEKAVAKAEKSQTVATIRKAQELVSQLTDADKRASFNKRLIATSSAIASTKETKGSQATQVATAEAVTNANINYQAALNTNTYNYQAPEAQTRTSTYIAPASTSQAAVAMESPSQVASHVATEPVVASSATETPVSETPVSETVASTVAETVVAPSVSESQNQDPVSSSSETTAVSQLNP